MISVHHYHSVLLSATSLQAAEQLPNIPVGEAHTGVVRPAKQLLDLLRVRHLSSCGQEETRERKREGGEGRVGHHRGLVDGIPVRSTKFL